MKTRAVLADIVLAAVILMGLTNFFAQFIVTNYKSDPMITLLFAGVAGVILGIRGGGNGGNGGNGQRPLQRLTGMGRRTNADQGGKDEE